MALLGHEEMQFPPPLQQKKIERLHSLQKYQKFFLALFMG